MTLLAIVTVVNGVAFVVYGVSCLASGWMKTEFERWGLGRFRLLVGTLEVLGGVGVLVGVSWPMILTVSSAGLSLLMLLGLAVRLKNRDGILLSMPAAVLMLVNGFIMLKSLPQ